MAVLLLMKFNICFCSTSHEMDDNDKHDAHAEILLQLSDATQELTQPTKSNCELPVDIPTHCTYGYRIRQNLKSEHKPLESIQKDSQQIHGVHGHVITSLQTLTCGHLQQEITEQNVILSCENRSPATTSTQDSIDVIDVKTEMKSDLDGYGRNTNLTRHWVTCPGGILKEVKAELTPTVSEMLPLEHCIDYVDENPLLYTHNVKGHERTRTSMKPFTCDICKQSFLCSSKLKMHARTHTGVKTFRCDICGKSYTCSRNLKRHEITHATVKPFECDTCGKTFTRSNHLNMHERTHTGVKPFTCDSCGKSFVQPCQLKLHERTHTGVKPFTCDMCGKSFTGSSNLKRHEMTHTSDKPFTCDSCGKSFVQSYQLKIHEGTHTGVKTFTCEVCGKSFVNSSSLKRHQMTHTGVKPFTCDVCGKSFACSRYLKIHERTHIGVKPVACGSCGKSFFSRVCSRCTK